MRPKPGASSPRWGWTRSPAHRPSSQRSCGRKRTNGHASSKKPTFKPSNIKSNPEIQQAYTMDFSLSKEQQAWQMKAREFAREEIRPIALKRDQIEGGFAPWDWDVIRKGSRLG